MFHKIVLHDFRSLIRVQRPLIRTNTDFNWKASPVYHKQQILSSKKWTTVLQTRQFSELAIDNKPQTSVTTNSEAIQKKLDFYHRNIYYFITNQQFENAESWFHKLKMEGTEPSEKIYMLMLQMYAKGKDDLQALERVFDEMKSSAAISEDAYKLMLSVYSNEKLLDKANKLLEEMQSRGTSASIETLNVLLEGHMKQGPKRFLDTYREIKQKATPDEATFNTLFKGCAKINRLDLISSFWTEMTDTYNIVPGLATYATAAEAYRLVVSSLNQSTS